METSGQPKQATASIDEASIMSKVDPAIIARATEWKEYTARSYDKRPYYFNDRKGISIWKKPQALIDLENAKLAAAQAINQQKSIAKGICNLETQKPKNPNKAADKKEKKTKAISFVNIPASPWVVVWTNDNQTFFYKSATKTSVWERPKELLSRNDIDEIIANPPDPKTFNRNYEQKIKDVNTSSALTPHQNKRSYHGSKREHDATIAKKMKMQPPDKKIEAVKKIIIDKKASIEAEVRASKVRAATPYATRVKLFMELLAEKQVSAFGLWSNELHKIVFDSRYLLLTSKERKQAYEKYVSQRADGERREKRNKRRARVDAYDQLLREANLHDKSTFATFALKYANDERFKGIEKKRHRIILFEDYLIEIKIEAKKNQLVKEEAEKHQRQTTLKNDFMILLVECNGIDTHSHWSDVKRKIETDDRYKAVESSTLREYWFRDYRKWLKDEKKEAKQKKREHKKNEKTKKERENGKKRDADEEDKKDVDKEKDNKGMSLREEKEMIKKDDNKVDPKAEETAGITSAQERKAKETKNEKAQEIKNEEQQARAQVSLKQPTEEVQPSMVTHIRERCKEWKLTFTRSRDRAIEQVNSLVANLFTNQKHPLPVAGEQLTK